MKARICESPGFVFYSCQAHLEICPLLTIIITIVVSLMSFYEASDYLFLWADGRKTKSRPQG